MASPNLSRPSIKQVEAQLPLLNALASVLIRRERTRSEPVVVAFVGAGPSASVGLPTSEQLKHQLYRELVGNNPESTFARALDKEAAFLFDPRGRRGILQLSLFEFASVASQFAHGREVIHDVLSAVLRRGSRRPLAYELLAHLARHGFVDHFVSLNFDELLDEALRDEVPQRLRSIASPDEVPGPRTPREPETRPIFLFKPFGSLSRDTYRLKPEETSQYGSESVWRFMINNAFNRETGNRTPDVCLVLVGYAAAEPAFTKLYNELCRDKRNVRLFAIDRAETLPAPLRKLQPQHIQLEADLAFDLLLQIIHSRYLTYSHHNAWIPIARHKVIANCLDQETTNQSNTRFKVELILQAVKSRGFFTVEGVAEIDRLRKHDSSASQIIAQMCREGILEAHPWTQREQAPPFQYLRQDYRLTSSDYADLASYVLRLSHRNPERVIDEWTVEPLSDSGWTAHVERITHREYLARRFTEIAAAPEIEVVDRASPATRWMFRSSPKVLHSVAELTQSTADLFTTAFEEAEDRIELYGVWVTGEWLFHDSGWAWPKIGQSLMERMNDGSLVMNVILAKAPPTHGTRTERANAVRERLKPCIEAGSCRLLELDWWRLNRTFTLLQWKSGDARQKQQGGGIYMRRRLATPLVTPVRVHGEDCEVLRDLFRHYEIKVRPDRANRTGSA